MVSWTHASQSSKSISISSAVFTHIKTNKHTHRSRYVQHLQEYATSVPCRQAMCPNNNHIIVTRYRQIRRWRNNRSIAQQLTFSVYHSVHQSMTQATQFLHGTITSTKTVSVNVDCAHYNVCYVNVIDCVTAFNFFTSYYSLLRE